ncbi:unnamed protein product [Auanema sp. JU1783]|nr:unnamed protein product [Auanema sp. JU1783]
MTRHDDKFIDFHLPSSSNTILNDLAHPGVPMGGPTGQERERMVQIFIRYLVLALEHMHDLRIAHLDLRPETILLQDDRLKLADFGQSRRLLRGLITGQIQGTPEFVSPEIVRGYPLTLATDLWSVGTITYVLLTGQSPFHGDNDEETLANVDKVRYSLDGPEWSSFSSEARDFISKLLCEIPADRLTCKEALQHEWLSSKDVLTAPLPADGLREFNYTHKWLERRVFVQQTPSEQLLDAILAPSIALAQQADSKKPPRETDRPVELYDYLRIKPRPPPEIVDIPKRRIERTPYLDQYGNPIDEHYLNQPPPYAFNDPNYIEPFNPQAPSHPSDSRRNTAGVPQPPNIPIGHPQQREQRRIPLDQYGRLIRAEDLARIPHDQYGRPIDIDEKQFLSPEKLPRLDESKLRQILPPGHPGKSGFKGPHQDYPDDSQMTEKRKLEPQTKGETPSKSRRDQPKQQRDSDDSEDDNVQVPVRMVRGERRDIEEEIANRILSDISEEGSVAGSLGSLDDFEQVNTIRQKYTKKSRSRSSTPKAESDASTPTLSPVNTIKESNFFPDTTLDELPLHEKELLEQADNDPNIPIGAPLFLEGLHNNTLIIDTAPTPSPNLLTPKSPRRSVPGTKSPVLLSPGKEHSMEVLIATKRGKPSFLPPGEQAAEIDDEDAHMDDRKKKIKPTDHKDDFEDLKDDLTHRKKVDDLDKYRPSNFYKDDVDFNHPGYDIDDSPWDSHYQIGPDTYLMASRGPSFNSRVRDYRRNLWGDGAPLVRQGILGVRNGEVTVKERRRFTDILREHSHNLEPKSNERATSLQKAPSATNAIDRIRTDIQKVAPSATRRNADGTYAPIFITRMRDAYLGERSAVFECSVTGSPAPTVEWTFHNQVLTNDDKRTIEQNGNIHRLIIHKPLPFDLGEYLCTATNEFGSDKTTSRLISGEAPSRPGRPDAELSSDTEIFLTWEAPEGHTYLEGITYRLEYRPAGPDDVGAAWIVISENVDDEAVVVKHLQPFGIYQFRVTARNGFGLGLPSLSSRIIQTHGKGAAKLQIEILKSYVRLNVVSLPQKSANQLNEISEESESEDKTLQEQITKENIELQTDNVLSRFQIDALIYKGRFAVVRKAVDNSQEGSAHCIAKIRDINEESVLREYEILKDAQHENVQRLIAAYNREGFLYLFCEQLYENVFSRFVFNDYYTEEQVCLTIRQVASALHWLHFRGIAHLDINPHNVMFQSKRNWIVKLVDFGSAQKLSTAVKPKEFNVLWAAPEFHIDDVPVTVQSDVWGMGVITFCLLGGFHPFTSEYDEITEVKHNVLNVKCDPNLIPVNASQESLSFATWALKKSPMRRMRTDEALSHRFLSSDPSMVRRREAVKYSASRLRKTLFLTKQEQQRPTSDSLENKFGGPVIQ